DPIVVARCRRLRFASDLARRDFYCYLAASGFGYEALRGLGRLSVETTRAGILELAFVRDVLARLEPELPCARRAYRSERLSRVCLTATINLGAGKMTRSDERTCRPASASRILSGTRGPEASGPGSSCTPPAVEALHAAFLLLGGRRVCRL